MANICCSIEMEPRTLREGQLNHAREVAADVVQKMEPKQASIIFVEGLRPVNQVKEIDGIEENGNREDDDKLLVCKEEAKIMLESPCQCSIITSDAQSPHQVTPKEPLSAPF